MNYIKVASFPNIVEKLNLPFYRRTKIASVIVQCRLVSNVRVNCLRDASMSTSSHSTYEKVHPTLYFRYFGRWCFRRQHSLCRHAFLFMSTYYDVENASDPCSGNWDICLSLYIHISTTVSTMPSPVLFFYSRIWFCNKNKYITSIRVL